MNFEEHAAKPLLAECGVAIPIGKLADTPEAAALAAESIGPCVIKAQVPIGKRGKAGGIQLAATPDEARDHAERIIGMAIGGHDVHQVLVEQRFGIARELYATVLNDASTKSPMVMFSTEGGMDIEEVAAQTPEKLKSQAVDIRIGFSRVDAQNLVGDSDLGDHEDAVCTVLTQLYDAYTRYDAELLEINPLIVTDDSQVVALDCKFVMDDSALKRHESLAAQGTQEKLTALEAQGQSHNIKYIELDGNVGVLANGAGLTMTTMDVVRHHGGAPANFCEIGGEAYTKAKPALEMVLAKPGIASLVVNFCGAFARCDVMMEGLLDAWSELNPTIPVFFSIAGTGDEAAIAMLKERLEMTPMADMSAACEAAVKAAGVGQ